MGFRVQQQRFRIFWLAISIHEIWTPPSLTAPQCKAVWLWQGLLQACTITYIGNLLQMKSLGFAAGGNLQQAKMER